MTIASFTSDRHRSALEAGVLRVPLIGVTDRVRRQAKHGLKRFRLSASEILEQVRGGRARTLPFASKRTTASAASSASSLAVT